MCNVYRDIEKECMYREIKKENVSVESERVCVYVER